MSDWSALALQAQAATAAIYMRRKARRAASRPAEHGFLDRGINLLGIASITGGINFIVTILRMRAPGMSINRMPLFTWMMMITSFLLVFALPSLTVASFFLLLRPPHRHALLPGGIWWRSAACGSTSSGVSATLRCIS